MINFFSYINLTWRQKRIILTKCFTVNFPVLCSQSIDAIPPLTPLSLPPPLSLSLSLSLSLREGRGTITH